ncbi:MAG: AGE family epimerase/isomerase [Bacteroidota bacterium]|nr:AGE family epimerase/isomerase [Bacteroidota bacterium]
MTATETIYILPRIRMEMEEELHSILDYWIRNMVDEKQGGFLGGIDHNNIVDPHAPKGVVLNSRILWTFSAAYLRDKRQEYLAMASRAYRYIVDHFIDRKYGGVYWSVDSKGIMLDGKKQVYGLAFCIYGLTEYYKVTKEEVALHLAENLFKHIENHSFDKKHGGYLEAFTQGWKPISDMRLSEKDENEKKTMNTHLHIIEAYTNLYMVRPADSLKESIKHLLDVFDQYFIDPQTSHLRLFMDESWNSRSSLISYGHDIEAAWLLLECAEITGSENYISRFKEIGIRLANAAAEGLDADGGLWYEYDPVKDELIREKHSWPQAEAMVGFLNAYQLTGEERYLHYSLHNWEFVKQYIKDNNKGEWFWGVNADHSVMQKEKAGFWKCPYHNSRACMELIRRIDYYK